jgi:hypothetical protein
MEVDDPTGGRNIDGPHGDPLPNRPRKRPAASKFAEPRRSRKVQVVRPGSDHVGEPLGPMLQHRCRSFPCNRARGTATSPGLGSFWWPSWLLGRLNTFRHKKGDVQTRVNIWLFFFFSDALYCKRSVINTVRSLDIFLSRLLASFRRKWPLGRLRVRSRLTLPRFGFF